MDLFATGSRGLFGYVCICVFVLKPFEKFILWLSGHKSITAGIVLIYFLLVVLPHEIVGQILHDWFFHGSRTHYNYTFIGFTMAGLMLFAFPFWRNLRTDGQARLKLMYAALTIGLIVLAYNLILVLATEFVHVFQYGLMAMLLFPLTLRYGETLFWASMLGALDEAWQYFYLAPEKNLYFDFNDVLLNLLGAALGLIGLSTYRSAWKTSALPLHKSPALCVGVLLLLMICLGLLTGVLALSMDLSQPGAILLYRLEEQSFWSEDPGGRFHIIQFWEAMSLIILLLAIYRGYFERLYSPP